jgi:hypothetical protein
MIRLYPGQGFRTRLVSDIDGVLVDPPTPVVTMHLPDGSVVPSTPARDSQGMWHALHVVPVGTPQGLGAFRWRSSGAAPSQNADDEGYFEVLQPTF